MGWEESAIAILIARFLGNFVQPRRLGTVLGSDGMLRLFPGLMRAPDVSFVARGQLKLTRGGERYPSIGPDLAVEVFSKSNTRAEIARKMNEYFAAGTRLAWVVDPKTETVRVHREPRKFIVLRVGDVLDGGDVIPGLRIQVQDLFSLEDDLYSPRWPPDLSLPQLTLFGRRSSLAGRPAGAPAAGACRRRDLLRHHLVEVRGLAGVDLQRGAIPGPGQALEEEVRGRIPGRVRRMFPAICGDFSFYQFPTPDYWPQLFKRCPRGSSSPSSA